MTPTKLLPAFPSSLSKVLIAAGYLGFGRRDLVISLLANAAYGPDAGNQMTAAPVSRKRTILVVDDEALVRSLTTRTLEDYGYCVIEAHDGFDAWTLLESEGEHIDLVLSDVVMPRLDGLGLARCMEIMSHPPPILLMSGYGLSALELDRPVLSKPFHADELLAAVHSLLAAPGVDDQENPNVP